MLKPWVGDKLKIYALEQVSNTFEQFEFLALFDPLNQCSQLGAFGPLKDYF